MAKKIKLLKLSRREKKFNSLKKKREKGYLKKKILSTRFFRFFLTQSRNLKEYKKAKKTPQKITKKKKESVLKGKILSIDFFHFLLTRSKNLKEYRRTRIRNAANAVENLVRDLGGDKNLLAVKNTIYSLKITFKSDYLLEREFLERSGGVDMRIVDRYFFSLFDRRETKLIAQRVKRIIKEASRKYRPVNLE